MLTMGRTKWIVAGCVASLALLGDARAEFFDFNPGGMGPDIFNPVIGAAGGSPYDWYYQGITLDYGSGFTDGRDGNVPYFVFDGTANSSAGHCLQVVFQAPTSDSSNSNPVQCLTWSYPNASGNDVPIFDCVNVGQPGTYLTVRMWIKNTGNGLYWHTKLADLDGNGGAWNQSATMNIWRLDKNQADCTTNAYNANTSLVYVTLIGTTGNYTVCRQAGGALQCAPGG